MRHLPTLLLILILVGCATDTEPVPVASSETGVVGAALEAEELNPEAVADLVDHGEVSLLPPDPVRLRQRMNLDQLAAAIARTFASSTTIPASTAPSGSCIRLSLRAKRRLARSSPSSARCADKAAKTRR